MSALLLACTAEPHGADRAKAIAAPDYLRLPSTHAAEGFTADLQLELLDDGTGVYIACELVCVMGLGITAKMVIDALLAGTLVTGGVVLVGIVGRRIQLRRGQAEQIVGALAAADANSEAETQRRAGVLAAKAALYKVALTQGCQQQPTGGLKYDLQNLMEYFAEALLLASTDALGTAQLLADQILPLLSKIYEAIQSQPGPGCLAIDPNQVDDFEGFLNHLLARIQHGIAGIPDSARGFDRRDVTQLLNSFLGQGGVEGVYLAKWRRIVEWLTRR